jgi:NACHT domain
MGVPVLGRLLSRKYHPSIRVRPPEFECLLTVSYRSSLVIDHLVSKFKSGGRKVAIVCLYCDYRDQEEQTSINMMGSLVKQLVMVLPKIPDEIDHTFKKSKKREKRLELEDASEMLMSVLQSFDRVYICVDALDECEREHRRSFLGSLNLLLHARNLTRICLFLTGRPHIESDVNNEFPQADSVRIEADKNDIMKYLSYKIDKDPDPKIMNEDLRREILNTITNGSGGMYVFQNDH